MTNALRISIAVLGTSTSIAAQNLVPNPGFETLLNIPCQCQQTGDMEKNVAHWHQGAASTADIMTTDAGPDCYANPKADSYNFGSQAPHSGKAMAVLICGVDPDWIEYVGTTLTKPMVIGQRYYVEAYVSLGNKCGQASNNLGFVFGTGPYTPAQGYSRSEIPQINCTRVIGNDSVWNKIGGYFTADKAYTTITIGNFMLESTTFVPVKSANSQSMSDRCCYFIDDIVVRSAGDLTATGDSIVNIGAKATLIAKGGNKYSWVDVRQPKVVLGTDAELKIPVMKKTTYRVSSGGDAVEITVDVRKTAPVYTQTLNGRKVRKGRTVNVSHDEVTISIHDKNEVDGDSVSLYYGDSLVCEHVSLTKKKQSFTIKVDKENPKQLILYAENLGSVPPNTAELTVKDGKNTTEIVLGSDFKWCDSIMLVYKEDD